MKYHIISERTAKEEHSIRTPGDVYSLLQKYKYDRKRTEYFLVITVDGAHNAIKIHIVTMGTLNRTLIHPREIFLSAIKDNACAIILAHNHPSGSVTPSKEDDAITKGMCKAGALMGIQVLDHLIITRSGYYSFVEEGNPCFIEVDSFNGVAQSI